MNDYNKTYPSSMTFYDMTDLLRYILEKEVGSGSAKICTALNVAWNDMCAMHTTAIDRANNADNMNKYYEAKLQAIRELCNSAPTAPESYQTFLNLIEDIKVNAHD